MDDFLRLAPTGVGETRSFWKNIWGFLLVIPWAFPKFSTSVWKKLCFERFSEKIELNDWTFWDFLFVLVIKKSLKDFAWALFGKYHRFLFSKCPIPKHCFGSWVRCQHPTNDETMPKMKLPLGYEWKMRLLLALPCWEPGYLSFHRVYVGLHVAGLELKLGLPDLARPLVGRHFRGLVALRPEQVHLLGKAAQKSNVKQVVVRLGLLVNEVTPLVLRL